MRSESWSNGAGSDAAERRLGDAVAHQRDDVGVGGDRRGELVAHRVVFALDAALAVAVASAEVVRRDQDEQDRRVVQRPRDLVAPAAAGGQVVLVEEDLLLAEQRVEVPGERGRLVGAVAGAVADENASGHRSASVNSPNPDAQVSRLLRHCVDPRRNEMDEHAKVDPRRRRRRRHRRRDRAPLRARGPGRLRHAAQRRQARAAGRADPGRRRRSARLRVRRAQGGRRRDAGRAHRARDRADRGRRLQHRRQRALRRSPRRPSASTARSGRWARSPAS